MQILTFRGEVKTPKVIYPDIHAVGSLAVIAQRLEMEGAKPLSRNSSHYSFRGGLGARFITSKWSFIYVASSGEVNTFAKDGKVVASYKICFDEWAVIALIPFIMVGLIGLHSFTQGISAALYLSSCLVPIFVAAIAYFGAGAVFAVLRFQRLMFSCLNETNQVI